MPDLNDKKKELRKLQTQISKAYGHDVLMTGKEALDRGVFDRVIIPTPSLEVNQMLWCGGFGGVVELYGPQSSGKTSLAIETLAARQRENPDFIGLWLETEHSIFPEILQQHGVDLERTLFVPQESVDNAENALDVIYSAISRGIPNMVVVNSVAGLSPEKEVKGELSKQDIALTARIMSKFFRKSIGAIGKTKTTIVFINQVRENVGQMFGNPETTTGGKALGFYAHQRIRMNSLKIQKEDPIAPEEGVKISCIVAKNRYAGKHNPNTKCIYYARYDTGIDSTVSMPQALLDNGSFIQKGAWWYCNDANGNPRTIAGVECKFNSKNALLETIKTNPSFQEEIRKMIGGSEVQSVTSEEREAIDREEAINKQFMADIGELDSAEE